MKKHLYISIIFVLCCIKICSAQRIYDNRIDTSCGLVWGPVWQLTPDGIDSGFPIIVNQGDTLHITMLSNDSGLKFPYIRSVDAGKSFEPMREIAPPPDTNLEIVAYCQFVVTSKTLYAFYNYAALQRALYMMKSTDQGLTWTIPKMVMDSMSITSLYRAGIEDTVFLGVGVSRSKPFHAILRTTDAGATWTLIPVIHRNNPDIAFLPGKLYRVFGWMYDSAGHWSEYVIQYKVSTDLGETWSDSINLSSMNSPFTADPAIAADPSTGKIVVAWRDAKYGCETMVGCSIIERHMNIGEEWSSEFRLTGRPNGYVPKITLAGEKIIIIWGNDLFNRANFRLSLDGGITWSPICDVFGRDNSSFSPQALIENNVLHVIGGVPSQFGPDTLFYRRGELLLSNVKESETQKNTFALEQNYPNPFNPKTNIEFRISNFGFVSLKVYDVFGREVAALLNETKQPGEYEVEWNAEGFASGVYFVRMNAGKYFSTMKAVLMK